MDTKAGFDMDSKKMYPQCWIVTCNLLRAGQPRKRLTHVYNLCKGKKICEGGDEMDLNPDNPDNQTNPVSAALKDK